MATTTTVAISFSHTKSGLPRALARGLGAAASPDRQRGLRRAAAVAATACIRRSRVGTGPPPAAGWLGLLHIRLWGGVPSRRSTRAVLPLRIGVPGSVSGIYCPFVVVVVAAAWPGRATAANLSSGQMICTGRPITRVQRHHAAARGAQQAAGIGRH